MPLFDEWGLIPESLEGPHENPVFVAPLLFDHAARAPSVEARERSRPAAIEGSSGGSVPMMAQEFEAPGTLKVGAAELA